MKKSVLFASAMMLLAATACNKEIQGDNPTPEAKPQVELSFNASLTMPTKTEIGVVGDKVDGVAEHQVYWSKGDKIAVYPHDNESTETKIQGVEFTSEDLSDEAAAVATFTGTIDEADAYYAFYPASADATWSAQHSTFSVKLSHIQKANGIASGFAVANVSESGSVTFDHVCGFIKFDIGDDLAGKIKEVRISGNGDEPLVGYYNVSPEDMTQNKIYTDTGKESELFLTPAEGNTFVAGSYYFTCLPTTLNGGLTITFVNSEDQVATKTSDNAATIERAGILNLGTVADLDFEDVTPPLTDGDYAILVKVGENDYKALSSVASGTRLAAIGVTYDGSASNLSVSDATAVWTFTNTSAKKYNIANSANYINHSGSSNTAKTTTEKSECEVIDNGNGTYRVQLESDQLRYLAYNESSDYFAFYGTNTSCDYTLYLKAVTYVEMPELQAPVISVTGNNEDKTVTVTWTDVEHATSYEVVCGEETQTVDPEVETCTLTMDDYGTYDVTVTAKADGYVSATSESVTCTLVSEDSKYYVKVTAEPADWSGNYLIVYEASATEAYVFNATDATSDYISVGLTSKGILKSNNVDAEIVSIEPMSGGFAINTKNGYIYGVSGSNALKFNPTEQQVNTISFDSSGNCLITSNEANLNFYLSGGNSRFRYYGKSTQRSIQLYRLQD